MPNLSRPKLIFFGDPHGDHDTGLEGYHDKLWHSDLAQRNLHGRVITVAGYQVAGLGGVFRESIWDPSHAMPEVTFPCAERQRQHMSPSDRWREGVSLRHCSGIFPDEFMRLARQRAHILVTHEGLGERHEGGSGAAGSTEEAVLGPVRGRTASGCHRLGRRLSGSRLRAGVGWPGC